MCHAEFSSTSSAGISSGSSSRNRWGPSSRPSRNRGHFARSVPGRLASAHRTRRRRCGGRRLCLQASISSSCSLPRSSVGMTTTMASSSSGNQRVPSANMLSLIGHPSRRGDYDTYATSVRARGSFAQSRCKPFFDCATNDRRRSEASHAGRGRPAPRRYRCGTAAQCLGECLKPVQPARHSPGGD